MEENDIMARRKALEEGMLLVENAMEAGELNKLIKNSIQTYYSSTRVPEEYVLLLDRCMALPLRLDDVEAELKRGRYSPDDVTRCAITYAESCFCEYRDFETEHGRPPRAEELHGTYLPGLILLFLRYGLQPNAIYGEGDGHSNIMDSLSFVDAGYAAADAMRLLLAHGGDPTLVVDDESIFDRLDFNIAFDAVNQEDRRLYSTCVHMWLEMIGYGGRMNGNNCPVELRGNLAPEIFREHEKFDFCIDFQPEETNGWRMSIFDRCSKAVVAVL